MRPDQWAVLAGGVAAIGGILWYFFNVPKSRGAEVPRASVNDLGVQEATIVVQGGYSPSEVYVRAGVPVRLTFDRRETSSCSEEVIIPDLKVRRFLTPNARTTVEFTPTTPGRFDFQCGMGMLHGKLVVQ